MACVFDIGDVFESLVIGRTSALGREEGGEAADAVDCEENESKLANEKE